ncbi:S8 family peptidase [Selenomonas artemidis]|uniref:S8 family peptidase n=1 Tax=Selenomonas artemidis TaxID=671224 RepID=UPI00288BB182|nr:S8 family peptidase [Selenomonas artemidis]
MAMHNDFTHLPLPLLFRGRPKLRGGGTPLERTRRNMDNRHVHGSYIKRRSNELSRFWKERRTERLEDHLPKIETGIPILLEIDPTVDVEFLRGLGFEIICELPEGFIIVATEDIDLTILNEKTDAFIANITARCNSPAKVYALCEETDRLKRVLSKDLYEKWHTIVQEMIYIVDVGMSCCGSIELPERPKRNDNETDEHYGAREKRWMKKSDEAYMVWDGIKMQREAEIEEFIGAYNGEIIDLSDGGSGIAELPDSFSARLKIPGKCLLDLVMNFSYIFEVSEAEPIKMGDFPENNGSVAEQLKIRQPNQSAPIVCVIDSGIQEGHKYLAPAIISGESMSLLPDNSSVSDEVNGGGHGTRVAGAILYPATIPQGEYQLPCWIRNMRILDENNCLPEAIYPPKIVATAVQKYNVESALPTKVFNHSVGERKPCEIKYMTAWAAEMDRQSYCHDVLFIQASGNVSREVISAYWKAGYSYPEYLDRELCRVSNPAQSLQAITVGSVSASELEQGDYISLGKSMEVSSFSRSGPGIWDVVKPDVVEYGGTHAYNQGSMPPQLTTPPEVCPELIRKSPEGPAFARDAVGTSFSAPKVTYIAAQIEQVLPEAPALLYRALIAQSARWPKNINEVSREECSSILRHIGYGIPDVKRATYNDEYRMTLVTPMLMELGDDEAHIFEVPIPEEISNVGEDYDILIEVTLSYAANPRRTRRRVKGYLSTWLDWCCSRIGERAGTFERRIFETGKIIDDDGDFKWVLGEAAHRGIADGYSRKNGTLQKDWCIIKSNQLSDAFCIAVRGHKGWGGLFKAKYALAVSFEAINQDIAIYEPIRNEIETTVEIGEIEVEMSVYNP